MTTDKDAALVEAAKRLCERYYHNNKDCIGRYTKAKFIEDNYQHYMDDARIAFDVYRQHLRDMGWLEMAERYCTTITYPDGKVVKQYRPLDKAVREELG